MAYQPHIYVTVGGDLLEVAANDEIWQVGLRGFTGGGGQFNPGDLDDFAEAIAVGPGGTTGMSQWFQNSASYMCNDANLRWVKVALINAAGDYQSAPGIYEFGSPVPGAAGAVAPSFNCVSLGFTTGKSFGRARSGRIYPPNYGCPKTFGAAITSAAQTALLDSALQFLSAASVQIDGKGALVPHVVSKSGVSNPITGVRVGNLYDVQRRRKNAVGETYATSPI